MNFAIEVKGLRKTFVSGWLRKRKKNALRGVNLSVPEGVFWGLLGPNGAGKTTLLSIISNLLIPEQGEVRVLGKDPRKNGMQICKRINVSSGHANFLWSLNVRENLEYFRLFYGFPPIFSHVLLKGYVMVAAYLVIEVLAMKAALLRAKRTGLLLKLSE